MATSRIELHHTTARGLTCRAAAHIFLDVCDCSGHGCTSSGVKQYDRKRTGCSCTALGAHASCRLHVLACPLVNKLYIYKHYTTFSILTAWEASQTTASTSRLARWYHVPVVCNGNQNMENLLLHDSPTKALACMSPSDHWTCVWLWPAWELKRYPVADLACSQHSHACCTY